MFGAGVRKEAAEAKSCRVAAYPYMMESFLKSRTESGNPSNVDYYEEDVNVYIVNLLCLLLDPVHYMQLRKYVADYDVDVFDRVKGSPDGRLRYWIYKANADHLLVSLGVFSGGGLGGSRRHTGESPEMAAGRGKTYYGFARSYCEALGGPSRAVADVLGKLSHGFDKYVEVLDHMRSEYLDLIDSLSEGEIFHLHREIERASEKEHARKKYDELLDLYLEWKKEGNDELVRRIKAVADEIGALDPSFHFKLPQTAQNN